MSRPSEDKELHERLKMAVERNLVTITTSPRLLAAPASPVFNPWESVGPLLALLMLALLVLLFGGIIAGTIAMVCAAVVYVMVVRPWVDKEVQHRATVTMMASPKQLQTLWTYGGVGLMLTDRPHVGTRAPKGNWRGFIERTLPKPEVEDDVRPAFTPDEAAAGMKPPERRQGPRPQPHFRFGQDDGPEADWEPLFGGRTIDGDDTR